ncbi:MULTISPECIES: Bcr/CflA family efflux MFS transporter [Priestia]|jgi:DHA1 family bicyclomycin/chloramphenicol resistance-like MFS transporter|uniref:Bcr/CflA family efflux transporter n=2 Tax=Priestia TaxID=2800373 RepID=D5E1L4_PRIM1|nr:MULTISPECIES: Bcr/CflA family efflux MFS transporter [Priestia]AVX07604.1 Bcr/CflA family multidrug efflux MFS transporter [Bacillus sp. Y-01]KOP73796.1 MFS transporter [Bacillus sp. FJAT-21351]KQU26481.1 MFS transporter [Bacillus sp. Leaf75]MBZ5478945.1 Bcr/CflA family efflux MFS transporter [Bacillus sp. T_4]MCJ7986890.1 Bcr/CflA family efflux MFS transporter [Priestia sp. OVL9]MDH6655546.1 DHA1 family bicyclomycin/chloramphenicol resistance-like MFS transporter [Bacillus sp. PvP124]MDP
MLHNPTGKKRLGLAFLLSTLAILGPLNIDMYLPSFPAIADHLDARASLVQLSLTSCLLGLAVGQIVIGPISDAKGRKGPLLISISLFMLSSLLCALAPTITALVIARFLQGFTASAGVVLSRAIVRDVFSGRELTKFFALLMVINAFAPMIAPMAGGAILLLPFASWHTIFLFLSLIGLLIVLTISMRLKETLPIENRTPSSIGHSVRTMGSLLQDRSFIGYALIVGLVHGGSFAYVSGTPFVYQGIYHVSPQVFSILFGINGLAIVTGSFIIGRFSGILHERSLLRIAVITAVSATSVLLIMTMLKGPLVTIVIPIFIYMISIGMTITGSVTLAMKNQGHRAGSASAVLGMLPLTLGSIVSPLVGINETTAIPMAAILFSTALLGFVAFFTLTKNKKETEKCDVNEFKTEVSP